MLGLAAVGVALALGGCLSSHARYTRSGNSSSPGGGARSRTTRTVPRDYDYRKHYRVPADRLTAIIESYIGVPYRWGGSSRRGMDCSGFVNAVFSRLNRAKLPRSSRAMSRLGAPVALRNARPGDLVFFRGGVFNRIHHVGIYVGGERFAHASSKKGVVYSSLNSDYYRGHFAFARRLF
jgi:cell wall-associated NlpC family hydrolase